MRVSALLFARPREIAGRGRVEVDLADGASAGDMLDALGARYPELLAMRGALRCAVGDEYVDWATALKEGAEVALIPPTAGG